MVAESVAGVDGQHLLSLPAGSIVFREGETGTCMYVVRAGKVRMIGKHRLGEYEVAVIGPGEFFGEMAILNRRPRLFTAQVAEDATLLVVDEVKLRAMFTKNPEIPLRMLMTMARRLDDARAHAAALISRNPIHRVARFLRSEADRRGTTARTGSRLVLSEAQMAAQLGLSEHEAHHVLGRLEVARLLQRSADGFIVAPADKIERYLDFLEGKEPGA